MKRQWEVRRQVQPVMDAARRWDRAYMLILGWSALGSRPTLTEASAPSPPAQEVIHEDGGVCARLDRAGQAQAQTIEQQLERLRAHVRAQGGELASEAVFHDDGISGATLNRPGLDRLRDAVRAGRVERVLVTDPDRPGCATLSS